MSKKKKGLFGLSGSSVLANYNSMPPDAMKTKLTHAGVDIASAAAGGLIGKFAGQNAALLGLAVILTGNLTGDKSGISRTLGVGLMAYGIGKWTSDTLKSTSTEKPTVKERFVEYKDELLGAFRLSNLFKKGADDKTPAISTSSVGSLDALDLSVLDHFEDFNSQEAAEFEARGQYLSGGIDDDDLPLGDSLAAPEFTYTVIEDDDLTEY